MFNQKSIVDYALSINVPIIGFSDCLVNNDEYLERLNDKKDSNTLYDRKQQLVQYYSLFEVLEDAKTVISIGIPYAQNSKYQYQKNTATFSITSYGVDYHQVVFEKMKKIIDYLTEHDSKLKYYYQCDTGVLDDRYFAYLCQNGVYGKHSQIINFEYGTQVFYGTIVINQKIAIEKKIVPSDLCLDCRLCLDACPTKSIDDYKLNYRSCISYLSQSHQIVKPELLSNCFYGCDLCSSVCPYNKPNSFNRAFEEKNASVDIVDFLRLSKKEHQAKYGDKGFSWLNRNILRKNLILLLDLNNKELIDLENEILNQYSSDLLKEAFDYKKNRL